MQDDIELSNLSKALEYERQAREIDKMTLTEAREFAKSCLLYTSPSPRDRQKSRMPSSA